MKPPPSVAHCLPWRAAALLAVACMVDCARASGVGKTAAGHLKPIAGPLLASAIPSDRLGFVLPVADLALIPLFGLVRQPVQ